MSTWAPKPAQIRAKPARPAGRSPALKPEIAKHSPNEPSSAQLVMAARWCSRVCNSVASGRAAWPLFLLRLPRRRLLPDGKDGQAAGAAERAGRHADLAQQ